MTTEAINEIIEQKNATRKRVMEQRATSLIEALINNADQIRRINEHSASCREELKTLSFEPINAATIFG